MEFYISETVVGSSSYFNRTGLSVPGIKVFFPHKNMFPIHNGNKAKKYEFEINFYVILYYIVVSIIIVSILYIDGYIHIALLNLSD